MGGFVFLRYPWITRSMQLLLVVKIVSEKITGIFVVKTIESKS